MLKSGADDGSLVQRIQANLQASDDVDKILMAIADFVDQQRESKQERLKEFITMYSERGADQMIEKAKEAKKKIEDSNREY